MAMRIHNGVVSFGNPKRRKNRPFVCKVLKTNYCNGHMIKTWCLQQYNSKALVYFLEVYAKGEHRTFTIGATEFGKNYFTMKDCRDATKKIFNLLEFKDELSKESEEE